MHPHLNKHDLMRRKARLLSVNYLVFHKKCVRVKIANKQNNNDNDNNKTVVLDYR